MQCVCALLERAHFALSNDIGVVGGLLKSCSGPDWVFTSTLERRERGPCRLPTVQSFHMMSGQLRVFRSPQARTASPSVHYGTKSTANIIHDFWVAAVNRYESYGGKGCSRNFRHPLDVSAVVRAALVLVGDLNTRS